MFQKQILILASHKFAPASNVMIECKLVRRDGLSLEKLLVIK
jgi:hypothetical protein